ncbi:hypothetical protein [Bosea lathyri]|uniref:Uncharacterized protein n=1 Tax=Bosea lathyri TaxID=1036778 RepID=A0A1H5VVY5_9HYPH|nr:hypothetical protein [Bosea lathyri]SEF90747.1 hypothetical protein SAMN04488115_102435 [Bosea lathyri]
MQVDPRYISPRRISVAASLLVFLSVIVGSAAALAALMPLV